MKKLLSSLLICAALALPVVGATAPPPDPDPSQQCDVICQYGTAAYGLIMAFLKVALFAR